MLLSILGLGGFVRILATILETISPIFQSIWQLLVWYIKRLWEGFCDILDNVSTILTVISLCIAVLLYSASLHKDTIIHQCKANKQVKRGVQNDDWKNIFGSR